MKNEQFSDQFISMLNASANKASEMSSLVEFEVQRSYYAITIRMTYMDNTSLISCQLFEKYETSEAMFIQLCADMMYWCSDSKRLDPLDSYWEKVFHNEAARNLELTHASKNKAEELSKILG